MIRSLALLPAIVSSQALPGAFDVVWNGPSAGCHNPALTLTDYPGIRVNKGQAFAGEEIVCFYKIGLFPRVTATMNQTACWSKHVPGCSWNPWADITPTANGGVPQVANVTAHVEALKVNVASDIPDPDFSGLAVIDWEAWRPATMENDDGLSCYTEYSRRLVEADPAWGPGSGKTPAEVKAEAARRFDAGAEMFFTATVEALRALRPKARIGFYSQGIDPGASSVAAREKLLWLWNVSDVLFPSIYPRSTNATAEAGRASNAILGAQLAADLAANASKAQTGVARRPAVYPYARALIGRGTPAPQAFTPEMLAAQIQVAAGMGAEGVVLWGASSDYHSDGCSVIEKALTTFAGTTIDNCVTNRAACAKTHCSRHGRCVDYNPANLTSACLVGDTQQPQCRCDAGFAGPTCAQAAL